MTVPAITLPPDAPQRNDTATFAAKAATFVAWLEDTFAGEMNDAITAINAALALAGLTPIIEHGSNANGEWWNFGDVFQVCTGSVTASSSADSTWTFPAAFSSAPVAVATAFSSNTTSYNPKLFNFTTTTVDYNVVSAAGARTNALIKVVAIGVP